MSKKRTTYCLLILAVAIFFGCKVPEKETLISLKTQLIDFENQGVVSKPTGPAFSGMSYTHCDGNNQFSGGFNFLIPDSLNNSFIRICIEMHYRKGGRNFGQLLVASIQNGPGISFWHEFDLNKYSMKKDEWIHVSDSTQIFYVNHVTGNEIRIFGYDVDKKSYLDIDDLRIEIKKVYPSINTST